MSASPSHPFASQLVASSLLVPTSVPGLYGQGQDFAAVTDAIANT